MKPHHDAAKNHDVPQDKQPPKEKPAAKEAEDTKPTQLATLQAQCQEYLNGWKRAQADYQNLKKETASRQTEMAQFANQQTIESFLPLVDYFTYAFKHVPAEAQNSEWLQGMKHIQSSLLKILADSGVEPVKTIGTTFDHDKHESVAEINAAEKPSATIIEETAAGFTRHGKVIRHAKVKVAK